MNPLAGLRLSQLPDRTPVKLTVHVSPDLHEALASYARLYEEDYGRAEPMAELVPAMLETFLAGDREFQTRLRRRG